VPEAVLISRSFARGRQDDQPDLVSRRINLYHEYTIPLVEYYDYCPRLLTINGDQTPEKVQQDILNAINR
jgi:adenylate kinase